jgi:hypothetical protein
MRKEPSAARVVRRACGVIVALSATALLAPIVQAQSDRSRSDGGTPASRDFGGTWDRAPAARPAGATPQPAPAETGVSPALSGSGVPGAQPSNGAGPAPAPAPPLKPEFLGEYNARQKMMQDATARGEPIANEDTHCLPQGMPEMMLAIFPMEVLQTQGQLTIIQEAFNQVRRIYIGGEPVPVEDAEPGFFGHSWAKWEGDTLVVETVGIKESVRLRDVPHSSEMRIHERIRKLDADHFEDEITIVDPAYLTGPWKVTYTYRRRPSYKMYEYVCEDNREFADPVTGEQRMRLAPRSQ